WWISRIARDVRVCTRLPASHRTQCVGAREKAWLTNMSLVEQAAKKLEQLRKAGEQVSGDLAYPVADGPAAPSSGKSSTIERMARELEKRPSLSSAGGAPQPIEPVVRIPQTAPLDGSGTSALQRREPVLEPAAQTPLDAPVPGRPRIVEI